MENQSAHTTGPSPGHAQLLDAIEHAVIAADLNGKVTLWSSGAQTMLGWGADDATGCDGIALIVPGDSHARAREILAGLSAGVSWEGLFPLRKKSGEGFWGHVTVSPVRAAGGIITGIVASIQNATSRKNIEEKIQRLEQQHRLASEASKAFTFEQNMVTGEIEFTEPVAMITGFELRSMADRAEFYRRIHPDDVDFVRETIAASVDPEGPGSYDLEYRFIHPDGGTRWLSSRARTFFEGEGPSRHAIRMIGMLMDITDSKKAQQEIARKEERLRIAVEGARSFTYERDFKTGLIELDDNAYLLLGFQVGAKPHFEEFYRHVDPKHAEIMRRAAERAMEMDHPITWQVDYRFTRNDGQVRWFSSMARTVFDSGSATPTRLIGLARDVTEARLVQEEIARKEERHRLAVEAANAFTYEVNLATGDVEWDDTAYELTGFPPGSQPDYDLFLDCIHSDDAPAVAEHVRIAVESDHRVSWEDEYRFRRPDGAVRWFNSRTSTLFDGSTGQNEPARVVGLVTDVTDKRRAEETQKFLSEASRILSSSLDYNETLERIASIAVPSQADICGVYLLQPEGNLQRVALMHRDPAKLDLTRRVTAETNLPETHVLYRVSTTGQSVLIRQVTDDSFGMMVRNDKQASYLRRLGQHSVMVVPLVAQGDILGALTLSMAETERSYDSADLAMAEELGRRCGIAVDNARLYTRLADSERRLALTLQVSGVGFYERGYPLSSSMFLSERLAEIIGYRLEDLPPPHKFEDWFMSQVHPDDLPRLLRFPIGVSPGRPRTFTAEIRIRHKKGHWAWLRTINHVKQRDKSGRVTRATGAVLDITDLKEAERTLREYNQELEARVKDRTEELERLTRRLRLLASELTATEQRERRRLGQLIHDDLQQLLVAAKLQVSSTASAGDDAEARRLREMAVSLLDQAIAESRSLTSQLRPPALYESGLVAALNWLSEWMKQSHGLTIELDLDLSAQPAGEQQSVVLFDSVRELLLNVVKYSGVSQAKVSLHRVDGWLRVSVSDAGQGFDVASLDSPRSDGGGFGLFSIRERFIVLGGRFEVHSAPGQGTTVELMWPADEPVQRGGNDLARHIPGPGVLMAGGAGLPVMSSKIRVLLVDDHAVVRQGIASVLDSEPDMVVIAEASNGEEAIEAVGLFKPQVVVMDVNLPGLNGVQASRVISDRFPGVRLIGLSIHNDRAVRQAMLDAGASVYLYKDGPVEMLLQAIRGLAESRSVLTGV